MTMGNKKYHPFGLVYVAMVFLSRMSLFIVVPFMAIILKDGSVDSTSLIGAVISFGYAGGVLSGLLGGLLTEKYGHTCTVVTSLAFFAAGFLLCLLFPHPLVFALSSFLVNFASNAAEPGLQSIVSALSRGDQVRNTFTLNYTMINVAGAVAPLVGTFCVFYLSSQSAFGFSFGMSLLLLVGAVCVFGWNLWNVGSVGAGGHEVRARHLLALLREDSRFMAFCGFVLLINMFYYQVFPLIAQYLDDVFASRDGGFTVLHDYALKIGFDEHVKFGRLVYGLLLFENAVMVIAAQLFFMPLLNRLTNESALLGGSVLIAASYFLFAWGGNSIARYVVAMAVLTVGEVLSLPRVSIMTDALAQSEKRGIYFGTTKSVRALGLAVGPALSGVVYDRVGHGPTWTLFSVLFLLIVLLYWKTHTFQPDPRTAVA
jgi:MFS family permease